MTDESLAGLTAKDILFSFPVFAQLLLINDDEFRNDIGLELDGHVQIAATTSFNRRKYFSAIRSLHAGCARPTLADDDGRVWTLALEHHREQTVVSFQEGDTIYRVLDPIGLKLEADQRQADLDNALNNAGLGKAALGQWRERLASAPLNDYQVLQLERALENTPVAWANMIGRGALRQISIDDLVPSDRSYYENLGGEGLAVDVSQLSREISSAHIVQLLEWKEIEGAKLALLLGSHASIFQDSPLTKLSNETLVRLADWVVASGDLIARISFLEIGLAVFHRAPELEGQLVVLADDLLTLDPEDKQGPLELFCALFALIDGQLSCSKIIADYAPFHRRHLALAQAALIERVWGRSRDTAHFAEWAINARGADFYLQTLVDMRQEPRWQAELATPSQLKQEFLGRVQNAIGCMSEQPTQGPLFDKVIGEHGDALSAALRFPDAFLPGPLEGGTPAEPRPLPSELAAILDASLEADEIEFRAVAAIINLRGLFHIDEAKIDRAVKLIREGGHRAPADADHEIVGSLLAGLADVAATNRNKELAAELRFMARRRRVESRDPTTALRAEFDMAMTAAAAYEDLPGWCQFVGDWISEITFATTDRGHAADLARRLDRLCSKAPVLRGVLGRSIAALQSFAQS